MPFFARPNLDNEQFKQLAGSQLTLSGQTRIASTSGLTLIGDLGVYVPIIVTGGTLGKVLTYDINNQITLQPSIGGSGGGIYSGASPTTCTVGGLVAGTNIYGTGITAILQSILVPMVSPTIVPPSSSFSINISPFSSNPYVREVGASIIITGTTIFDRGSVAPQYYGTSPYRSGSACYYQYCKALSDLAPAVSSISPNIHSLGSLSIAPANNYVGSKVFYTSGCTPIYNSTSGISTTTLPSGSTPSGILYNLITICGIYPYYYGKVASGGAASGANRPAPTAALITGGTKIVASSMSTISATFGSTSDDYLWFAIPNPPTNSALKTKWCVDASNNGNIGGAATSYPVVQGNLFPTGNTVINVANGCWSNLTYKLYISNYQSATIIGGNSCIMYLKNS